MQLNNKTNNPIVQLTFNFSLRVIEYCELLETMKKFCLARQLLKSGTSIGANVWEAQNSESKSDFIHKFKIAAKEVYETKYWTYLCQHSKSYPDSSHLITDLESISKIITKIISTSKRTLKEKPN